MQLDVVPARIVATETASGLRPLVAFHPAVAARYDALVAGVARTIEASLRDEVVAHRVASIGGGPARVALRPWRLERRRYANAVRDLTRRSAGVLALDVRAFYASVDPDVVERVLRSLGAPVRQARRTREFLVWLRRFGVRGLPVGPAPSAVLANAVLTPLDDAIAARGHPFVRWVDDVLVALPHVDAADHVLAQVDEILRTLELERNRAKTRLLDASTLDRPAPSAARARAASRAARRLR